MESAFQGDLRPCRTIALEFARSSSPLFNRAIQIASRYGTFSRVGPRGGEIFRVEFRWEQWPEAMELVDCLKGWRNRWVYVDGERQEWNKVFEFLYCFRACESSADSVLHCFEGAFKNDVYPFGCAYSGLGLLWPRTGWLRAGKFLPDGSFRFDKERMRKSLERNLFQVRFCPALDLDRAGRILTAFPESVNPAKDQRWEYDCWCGPNLPAESSISVMTRYPGGPLYRAKAYGVRAASRNAAGAIVAEIGKKMLDLQLPTADRF